ncbi:AAA family ATPase [Sphingomonas sp. Leaf343]|uniref:AAA family ATPase n=1 Tax=Sphingomonas sp. Leaf343 TaxID=1736345 RepID=UPI0006FFB633|nr:AAA family ATPase [Sphingomonas sp. Leaf343]KQR83898.1 ATP-binding protein [Sphingomonas sp. Leaf343]
MARGRHTTLPPPYLKRVWIDPEAPVDRAAYPFCLPLFAREAFELRFDAPVTILVGENGVGKSTLLEGIAVVAGFDEGGGGPGYRAVDHSTAIERGGGDLSRALKAAWLPRIGQGWFFRAESFFTVARYLDDAARGNGAPPDFLSHSHGEGFLRFFQERCTRPGLFIFDEPESALSPKRQFDFLKLLRIMQSQGQTQVIMATHSPILMALPDAVLLQMSRGGLAPVLLEETDHYRLTREFILDPHGITAAMLDE